MKSMTGFSEATLNKDGIQFKCFVKSLNSRFIEVNIKLPNNLKKHEGWIRDLIKKSFARGKIDMDLHYTSPPKEHLKVSDNFIKLVKQNEKNAKSKGLDLVTKLMKSKDLIGKKLDFYTQEMLRETNTLSSKALIAEIKNEAVELKSLIEKMKEHAQNVE